jgi:hypothetical protein
MKRPTNVLLTWAGAALVLLGCTQDPVGTAPGGLEPSPNQQREDRDDTRGGGSDGGSGGGY